MEIISYGIEKCKEQEIHVLEVIGFNMHKRNMMEKYYPYKRKLPSFPLYYKTRNELLSQELENIEVWDPCCFDGDASLN